MAKSPFESNVLYYGDNLEVLRKHFPNECVDLIYLDPPFNSKADYNILFKESSGEESAAQIQAFSDFWHWDKTAEKTYLEIQEDPNLVEMIQFLKAHLGRNDMMAYLVMMTIRLRELHRVLKHTGSLYLHCDPTASHYLKIILDKIFGSKNFRNEIVWQRFTFHADAHRFGRVHDVLLFYTKTDDHIWNTQFSIFKDSYIKSHFTHSDKDGRKYQLDNPVARGQGPPRYFNGRLLEPPLGTHWRWSQENIDRLIKEGVIVFTRTERPRVKRYLDEARGHAAHSVWTDIPPINSMAKERVGFETQKPMKLLERIIVASSNEGDLVLDPFCGCGTTIIAAQGLKEKRRWIGIDITHLAISLIRSRLKEIHVLANKDYKIVGEPADLASAVELMKVDPTGYQFQWWALSLIDAKPAGQSATSPQGKKGADRGVDGWLTFKESDSLDLKRIVVQVKGGHVGAQTIRDLLGTVESTKSAMGILITLNESTEQMRQAAMEAEYYESPTWGQKYPKIQILIIPELLKGSKPILPHTH
jgi:site-specific DNA-methyltransferase (adenine-specific)